MGKGGIRSFQSLLEYVFEEKVPSGCRDPGGGFRDQVDGAQTRRTNEVGRKGRGDGLRSNVVLLLFPFGHRARNLHANQGMEKRTGARANGANLDGGLQQAQHD